MDDRWSEGPPPFPGREYDSWKTESDRDELDEAGSYDSRDSKYPARLPQPEPDPFADLEPDEEWF